MSDKQHYSIRQKEKIKKLEAELKRLNSDIYKIINDDIETIVFYKTLIKTREQLERTLWNGE